jgi:hypothetical protein
MLNDNPVVTPCTVGAVQVFEGTSGVDNRKTTLEFTGDVSAVHEYITRFSPAVSVTASRCATSLPAPDSHSASAWQQQGVKFGCTTRHPWVLPVVQLATVLSRAVS